MTKNILFLIAFLLSNSTDLLSQSKLFDSIPDRLKWDKTKKNTKELNALLSNPLDLQKFKKTKKSSNSGGGPDHKYLYKPDYNGFYYHYFIFAGFGEGGPRVTTYKKGKDIGGYMDTSEVFIQLACNAPDKDLGKANIFSNSADQILKKFGDNYIKKGQVIIYKYDKTLLIVSYGSGKTFFKIAKVSKAYQTFDKMNQTKDLISYH